MVHPRSVTPRRKHRSIGRALIAGLLAFSGAACTDDVPAAAPATHLALDQTLTREGTAAGQVQRLTLTLQSGTVVRVRAWSLGPLVGVRLQLQAPDGRVAWQGTSVGTEIRMDGVRVDQTGTWTLQAEWTQGAGVAQYRYEVLYTGDTPVQRVDPVRLAWARRGAQATALTDGRAIVSGGIVDGVVVAATELVSVGAEEATRGPDLAVARAYHSATRLGPGTGSIEGQVLLAGGLDTQGEALLAAELWDPVTEQTTPLEPLPEVRAYHVATFVTGTGTFVDGRVLLVGGEKTRAGPQHDRLEGIYREVDENIRQILYFDADARRFEDLGELDNGRILPAVAVLPDGRILVIGGGVDRVPAYPGCDAASSEAICWCTSTDVPLCTEHKCTLDECTYTNFTRKDVATDAVAIYDTAIGALLSYPDPSAAPRLNVARLGAAAIVLADGRVVVAGGATALRRSFNDREGGLPEFPRTLDSVEIFDPDTNAFSLVPPLSLPREQHAILPLPDGRAIAIGGITPVPGGTAPVGLLEAFDPAARRFFAVDALSAAHGEVLAVLLAGGRTALVLGTESPEADLVRFKAPGGSAGGTTEDVTSPDVDAGGPGDASPEADTLPDE